MYKPYTAFRGHAANAAPHVPVPHIPASNLTSPIATSTPAETLFQISNPGSTPILHSEPPIPMLTPPPVATTPIAPTRCLACTSDLSPNQLPFEMLDLGRTSHRSHRTWTRSDAVPSHRENSCSRSPNISHRTSYAGQYDVCPQIFTLTMLLQILGGPYFLRLCQTVSQTSQCAITQILQLG